MMLDAGLPRVLTKIFLSFFLTWREVMNLFIMLLPGTIYKYCQGFVTG